MKMKLRIIISLWIGVIIFGSCEERADYLNWSRKVAKYCRYVKYSEESKRYECGPKLGEFYTYIIVHPDYDLPKNPIYPLVAYDGNDNVVMVGGNGKGQIWRMIKFEKWEFVREAKIGMKEVYYDEEEEAFIGLEKGDNKENVQSMAWWSRDGGKSWYRASVPIFNKNKGKPVLPAGARYEAVGGGYAVAIGKVGVNPTIWRSIDKVSRDWKVILGKDIKNPYAGSLPGSLQKSSPSDLKKVSFVGVNFRIEDGDGDIWISKNNGQSWDMEKFAGGDGTTGNPYQIGSAAHLWQVRNHLKSNFELVQDLDLSVITEREGFEPIGAKKTSFEGTFDGNGKKIKKLKINRPAEDDIGLFGLIGKNAVFRNIELEDVNVIGGYYVGGLVGLNLEGEIQNSYATGNVKGKSEVGLLVGHSRGEIQNSYATGNVKGKNKIGGLVGYSQGKIENSYATVKVDGEDIVGGLLGHNYKGIVKKSYAMGRVTGTGARVGGLVGNHSKDPGTIEESYATGRVEGARQVGGLVGESFGPIRNSYATGEVIVGGTGVHRDVGGFLGKHADGEIENSYSTGQVRATAKTIYQGGFVGNCVKNKYKGTTYWRSGSARQGIGNLGGNPKVIRKLESELKALDTTVAGSWAVGIWNFKPGEYPKLQWQ